MTGKIADYSTDLGWVYRRVRLNSYFTNLSPSRTVEDLTPLAIQAFWQPGASQCSLPKGVTPRYLKIKSVDGDELMLANPISPASPLWGGLLTEILLHPLITSAQTIGEKIDGYRTPILAQLST